MIPGIKEFQEVGCVEGDLAVADIGQIRADSAQTELRKWLVDVVARDALAVPPPPSLVGPEARPSDLLGMAGDAAKALVLKLSLRCDPGQPFGVGGSVAVVVVRRERPELGVRADHDPEPRDEKRPKQPDEKEQIALHDARVCASAGGLKEAGAESFRIMHEVP